MPERDRGSQNQQVIAEFRADVKLSATHTDVVNRRLASRDA